MSVYRTRQRSKSPSQWWVKCASKVENSTFAFLNGGCNVMLILHLECQHIYKYCCWLPSSNSTGHIYIYSLTPLANLNCCKHRITYPKKHSLSSQQHYDYKAWKWMSYWFLAYRWPSGISFFIFSAHKDCYYSIQVYKKKKCTIIKISNDFSLHYFLKDTRYPFVTA